MMDVRFDAATGIVTSTVTGILTLAEAEQGRVAIRTHLASARARSRTGGARYLVDARTCPVQPRDVIEQIERDGSHLSHPDDRMAVVVASALAAMQTRRVFTAANERAFDNMDDAVAWLTA